MAKSIDDKYIKDHMIKIHSPDSWGRALMYNVLGEAAKSVGGKATPTVAVNGTFHVSAVEASGCVQLCYETPWGPICIHVEV